MITVTLQVVVAALTLAFGVVCGRVAARASGAGEEARGWRLTAATFCLVGGSGLLHSSAAVWAFVSGAGTPVYQTFVRWSPAGNHSRSVMVLAFGALLAALVYRSRGPARWNLGPLLGVLATAAALGGWLGWREGALHAARHYPVTAVLDLGAVLLILAALLGGLTRVLDRLLWICLSLYALREVLNVVWFSARAWLNTPGAWYPTSRQLLLISATAWTCMLLLAARRLRLARRGVPVPALAADPAATVSSMS